MRQGGCVCSRERGPTRFAINARRQHQLLPQSRGEGSDRRIHHMPIGVGIPERLQLRADFLFAQARDPVDVQDEFVIHSVQNARAPGRQPKDGGSAYSIVSDEECAPFPQSRFRNRGFDVLHGNAGQRTQPRCRHME